MGKLTKGFVVLATTMAFVLGGISIVAAQTPSEEFLDGKLRVGDTVEVPAGETVDGDLYVFGGSITVAGDVDGDVIAFGGQVDISGRVSGDVFTSGGTVTISGDVAGDVRASGGQISLSGDVAEDAALGGGQIRVTGTVGNDLMFAGGQSTISGDVLGDVLGRAGTNSITGDVGGVTDVEDGDAEESDVERAEPRGPVMRGVLRLISLLLFGAVLFWLFRRPFDNAVERIDTLTMRALGFGALFLIGIVVVPLVALLAGILLAVVTGLVGLSSWAGLFIFAMITVLVVYGFLVFLALTFVAPTTVAGWVGKSVLPSGHPMVGLAVGILILVVLGLIPIIGGLVGLAVALIGTGAWLAGIGRKTSPQGEVVAVEA